VNRRHFLATSTQFAAVGSVLAAASAIAQTTTAPAAAAPSVAPSPVPAAERIVFGPFAVRDGLLIGGQQVSSGARTSELVIQALEA